MSVMVKRFWARVSDPDEKGCTTWMGARFVSGYGDIGKCRMSESLGGIRFAHQVSWIIQVGPLTNGLILMHSCDNPPCVALAHLSEGTQAQNLMDARLKGRLKPPPGISLPGESNPASKLTEVDVYAIRSILASGTYTQLEIARAFGVSQSCISFINGGQTWPL